MRLAPVSLASALLAVACSGPELVPVPPVVADSLDEAGRAQVRRLSTEVERALAGSSRGSADLWGRACKVYLGYGFARAAMAACANATALDPSESDWRYLEAVAGYRAKDRGAADRAFRVHLEEAESPRVGAFVRLAEMALEENRLEEAERWLGRAAERAPEEAVVSHLLGQVAQAEGRFDEALEHFERALRLDPAADAVHHSIGTVLRDLGRNAEARRHLGRAGSVSPRYVDPVLIAVGEEIESPAAFVAHGDRAANAGRFERAAELYRRALARDPSQGRALHNLGVLEARAGDFASSVEYLQRAAAVLPSEPDLRYDLAGSLLRSGRIEEAIGQLEVMVELDPNDVEGLRLLAGLLARTGRFEVAASRLGDALELRPESPSLWNGLGAVRSLAGRSKEALAAHRRAIEANPEDPLGVREAAMGIFRLGGTDEAIELLEEGRVRIGDRPAIVADLGWMLAVREGAARNSRSRGAALARRAYDESPRDVDPKRVVEALRAGEGVEAARRWLRDTIDATTPGTVEASRLDSASKDLEETVDG